MLNSIPSTEMSFEYLIFRLVLRGGCSVPCRQFAYGTRNNHRDISHLLLSTVTVALAEDIHHVVYILIYKVFVKRQPRDQNLLQSWNPLSRYRPISLAADNRFIYDNDKSAEDVSVSIQTRTL